MDLTPEQCTPYYQWLMRVNDLSSDIITSGLETRFIGQRTLYFPSLPTTIDTARQEALGGAPEGTVIITGEQTAGRGRLQRAWISPPGNIALSVILYPEKEYLYALMMVASLAVTRCIEAVTSLRPEIKWPNDVLINGKKVCGVLIESDVQPDRVNYAIMGIGINVNLDVTGFPEIQSIATSLSHELGKDVPLLGLVRQLLNEIEFFYLAASAGDTVYEQWQKRLVTIGKKVVATSAGGESTIEGFVEAVGRDGSLWLRLPDRSLTQIFAGDVTLSQ